MSEDYRKRLILAVALLGAAGAPVSRTQALDVLPHPSGLAAIVPLAWLSTPPAQIAAVAAVVLMLALFVRGRAMQLSGLAVFVIVLALNSVARSMTPGDEAGSQGSQVPCTTLAAWIVGSAIAPRLGRDRDELGTSLACGIVAAGYTMAAISKLLARGVDWVDGPTLALMIYERAPSSIEPLASLRRAVSGTPWLCSGGMGAVLLLEASGALFLFRRARRAYAACIVAFHVSSGLLLGYPHVEWALMTVAWAWAGGGVRPAAPPRAADRSPLRGAAGAP